MVNHYAIYVTFQDIKHQIHEDILHYLLIIVFYEIEKNLSSTENYLLEGIVQPYKLVTSRY